MARGCGDSEDHAVLLCNLLLGFGLDAFVIVGVNSEGAHAWVMTRTPSDTGSKPKITFWESLTGTKIDSDDPRAHRLYSKVGCVFNHQTFFANIQADDRCVNTNWNLKDEYSWKAMDPGYINIIKPNSICAYLMPSPLGDIGSEEKMLENILKDKVGGYRSSELHLGTTWDNSLGYLLSTALVNYETERIGGYTFAADEF